MAGVLASGLLAFLMLVLIFAIVSVVMNWRAARSHERERLAELELIGSRVRVPRRPHERYDAYRLRLWDAMQAGPQRAHAGPN